MLELLEELPEPFRKAFQRQVGETELTVASVTANDREALVFTNRYFYYLKKRFILGIDVTKEHLPEITRLLEDTGILTVFVGNSPKYRVSFSPGKKDLPKRLADLIMKHMGSNR